MKYVIRWGTWWKEVSDINELGKEIERLAKEYGNIEHIRLETVEAVLAENGIIEISENNKTCIR